MKDTYCDLILLTFHALQAYKMLETQENFESQMKVVEEAKTRVEGEDKEVKRRALSSGKKWVCRPKPLCTQ